MPRDNDWPVRLISPHPDKESLWLWSYGSASTEVSDLFMETTPLDARALIWGALVEANSQGKATVEVTVSKSWVEGLEVFSATWEERVDA